MKTKWLYAKSTEEIEKLCNEFDAKHNVKAMQSHVKVDNGIVAYFAVIFYDDRTEQQKKDDLFGGK